MSEWGAKSSRTSFFLFLEIEQIIDAVARTKRHSRLALFELPGTEKLLEDPNEVRDEYPTMCELEI